MLNQTVARTLIKGPTPMKPHYRTSNKSLRIKQYITKQKLLQIVAAVHQTGSRNRKGDKWNLDKITKTLGQRKNTERLIKDVGSGYNTPNDLKRNPWEKNQESIANLSELNNVFKIYFTQSDNSYWSLRDFF